MKELRWTVQQKGNPYILKAYKYKWMAKLYAAFRCGKHSIKKQKIHIQK